MSDIISEDDLRLLSDAEIMLKKRILIDKMDKKLTLLGESLVFKRSQLRHLPPEVVSVSPKVSKGENYKGLPYLVLDFPRFYRKQDVLAFRVMIWWGRHISAFIHLKGHYLQSIDANQAKGLQNNSLLYAISENEWEQENSIENFKRFEPSHLPLIPYPYLKLGAFLEIQQINQIDDFVDQVWDSTMGTLYC